MGDLALPCFRLSKALRRSPVEIAKTLAENVKCEEFSEITALNGYLNFKIDGTNFAKRVIDEVEARGEKYGAPAMGEGKTVVLDYSSPNVAKPFHIGHLGTTVIGHSLKLLHEFAGYKCVGINYLGDWGTQFGKLIVAYKAGQGARAKNPRSEMLHVLNSESLRTETRKIWSFGAGSFR